MNRTLVAIFVLIGTGALADTNRLTQPSPATTNLPTIMITGELRAFGILGQTSITVPWQKWFTLEKVATSLGGFTEYAFYIQVEDASGVLSRFDISREFMKDESVRKMKIKPGAMIRVRPMYD